jgi:hypothetical protein
MLKKKVISPITFLIISYLIYSGGMYLSKPLGYSLLALIAIISSISLYKFVKEREHGWISFSRKPSKFANYILQSLNYAGVLVACAIALIIIFRVFTYILGIGAFIVHLVIKII